MATFSINPTLLASVHTLVLNALDGGSSNAYIDIRDVSNTLLVSIPLTDPSGVVDSGTGELTLSASSAPNAVASGTADHGDLCDSTGEVWISLPVVAGTVPVSDSLTVSSTTIVEGYPVELVSATIG